jgi:hypothetical protein
MTSDMEHQVTVEYNKNVFTKVLQLAETPEETIMQEIVDNLYANLMFLMTALEPRDAGGVLGRILTETAKQAAVAKDILVMFDEN